MKGSVNFCINKEIPNHDHRLMFVLAALNCRNSFITPPFYFYPFIICISFFIVFAVVFTLYEILIHFHETSSPT